MNDVKKTYEGYWKTKEVFEEFEDYERNPALRELFSRKEKVLDLASGHGTVAEFIKSLGNEVVALDISKEALKKVSERGIAIVYGNVEKKLPFEDKSFDCVFWGDNTEHLFSPLKTLKEINRILKPDGRVIISCPNMGYLRYRLYYLFFGMIPQTEWYKKNPWEWTHIRFFNQSVMKNFLKEGGFELKRFFGVSRRRLDRPLLNILPSLFGMIMIVEAEKKEGI